MRLAFNDILFVHFIKVNFGNYILKPYLKMGTNPYFTVVENKNNSRTNMALLSVMASLNSFYLY